MRMSKVALQIVKFLIYANCLFSVQDFYVGVIKAMRQPEHVTKFL